jgi:hypothetical protein
MLKSTTKIGFHRKFSKVLREVAQDLGLQEFEVRSCKGGPAVYGEVILHAPNLYVQICGDSCVYGSDLQVLYRSCTGMKDYTGGRNRWMKLATLVGDRQTALPLLRSAMVAAGKEAKF